MLFQIESDNFLFQSRRIFREFLSFLSQIKPPLVGYIYHTRGLFFFIFLYWDSMQCKEDLLLDCIATESQLHEYYKTLLERFKRLNYILHNKMIILNTEKSFSQYVGQKFSCLIVGFEMLCFSCELYLFVRK